MSYEWDPAKARSNLVSHAVHFSGAVAVLADERAPTIRDPVSEGEERWITLDINEASRLLVVVYAWRGDNVRLIPARPPRQEKRANMKNAMKREYDFSKARRGPVISVPRGKTRITIRLDDDILAWFREQVQQTGGGNYQTLINEALRQHMHRAQEPLEKTLRRVIREELSRAS